MYNWIPKSLVHRICGLAYFKTQTKWWLHSCTWVIVKYHMPGCHLPFSWCEANNKERNTSKISRAIINYYHWIVGKRAPSLSFRWCWDSEFHFHTCDWKGNGQKTISAYALHISIKAFFLIFFGPLPSNLIHGVYHFCQLEEKPREQGCLPSCCLLVMWQC